MDIKYAFRSLLRQPLFTFGAVATLALGIGVNSTIFTFANAALLRAMPGVASPDELVWVSAVWRDRGREVGMSYPEYTDYRDGTGNQFSALFAFRNTPLSLGSGGDPQRVRGQLVTGSYFAGLGVRAVAGRLIDASDDRQGAAPTAVLGHRLWQQRFGGAAEVIGSSITVNGRQVAVIGVADEGFYGPALGETADLWLPLASLPQMRSSDQRLLTERGSSWLSVMGRLRPGTSARAAQAALGAIAARLEQAYPESSANRGVAVSSARTGLAPESRGEFVPLSILLLTVTAIVLLIACANVANLLLARGTARAAELSIRAAIGASRRRLLRQLLTESMVLAVLGAAAGLLVSFWATDLLQSKLPEAEFRGLYAAADLRVLLFTTLLALISVSVFGLLPAFTLTRGALLPRMRQTPAAGGRSRLQGAFVVAQLSLSLVLLLAGGLSLRALQKASHIDLGFNPEGMIAASYDLELQNYTPERRVAFRRQLRDRLAALPGVTAVGVANMPPLGGTMVSTIVTAKNAGAADSETRAYLNAAGPGYFDALQTPILRGRAFQDADTVGAVPAAIVNERLARNLWGNDDPIGREITIERITARVVGVARDAKYDEATEDPRPFMYLSLDQHPQIDRETVLLRTSIPPATLLPAVRSAVQALDPAMPVFDVLPFTSILRERSDKERAISTLLGAFGAVALRLATIGVGIGVALSIPMAYALGALLFGVQIADVAAFALACALLVGVALLASLLPARRAARLDPIVALRAE